MKRIGLTSAIVFSIFLSVSGMADENYRWLQKPYAGTNRPGVRKDFAAAFYYFAKQAKTPGSMYLVNGGIGPGNAVMDEDGTVWAHYIQYDNENWTDLHAEAFCQVPPPRYGHAGAIWDVKERSITQDWVSKNLKNFVTFGGKNGFTGQLLNSMWIFCQAGIPSADDDVAWLWIPATQQAPLPQARMNPALVYVPAEGNEENEVGWVFLMGGTDGDGKPILDMYIGRLTRTLTFGPSGDPWDFSISIDCEWTDYSSSLSGIQDIGYAGQSAIYDPYYGDSGRILIFGGEAETGLSSELYACNLQFDEESGEWEVHWEKLNGGIDKPAARKYHAAALDSREHRLMIHGGRDEEGDILSDLCQYNFLTGEWDECETTPVARCHHKAFFFWFTLFGGISGPGANEGFMDDMWQYKPETTGKTWDIEKGSPYGLDNPEKVINTTRIKPHDLVRIHSAGPDDFYEASMRITVPISPITVEGVSYEGIKARVYRRYPEIDPNPEIPNLSPEEEQEILENGEYTGAVLDVSAGATIRNLEIGAYDGSTPKGDIPEETLDHMTRLSCNEHSPDMFAQQLCGNWCAISTRGPVIIENCDIVACPIGIKMICVSTNRTISATISDCRFINNFIGASVLETAHDLTHNEFRGNYLAGVYFEKGAHGLLHENLFVDNGRTEACESPCSTDDWPAAVFANFDIVYDVPLIQKPLIYNNTFIDNRRTVVLSSEDDKTQYMNIPVFINNIVWNPEQGSEKAIYKLDDPRLQILSRDNFFYCNGEIFSDAELALQSVSDHDDEDPLFIDSAEDYRLDDGSPCIDAGLFNLFPEVTSENAYQDYGILDIGYHFTGDPVAIGSVVDLTADYEKLFWSPPEFGDVQGYMIIIEYESGASYGNVFLSGDAGSYTIPEEERGLGFWFGVSAYNADMAFGYPEFIQM